MKEGTSTVTHKETVVEAPRHAGDKRERGEMYVERRLGFIPQNVTYII